MKNILSRIKFVNKVMSTKEEEKNDQPYKNERIRSMEKIEKF